MGGAPSITTFDIEWPKFDSSAVNNWTSQLDGVAECLQRADVAFEQDKSGLTVADRGTTRCASSSPGDFGGRMTRMSTSMSAVSAR